jgi:adenine-specific DNA methylase
MQARRAQAVADEFETMRAIAKKEREVAKKLEAVRLETEARIAREAAIRDAERKKKVEEKLKKSQAILKEIERKGEESRLKAIEKEKRIQAILEARSRVASRRLHFTETTRVHQTSRFGPRRGHCGRGDGVVTRPR